MARRVAFFILLFLLPACMQTRYLLQAGPGQLELWQKARDLDKVLRDPSLDERTRLLLAEVPRVLEFARARGLDSRGNYRRYVPLHRGAVVWFLVAAEPLSLQPLIWHFPIVGSFPYLGWFDYLEAREVFRKLEGRGYDVYMRPVQAYSTGGWFNDPVLSTMLSPDTDAFRYLIGTLLHELTHANVLINDQSTFNESVASFVGDTMTDEYLSLRFGPDSEELILYRTELADARRRGARYTEAYAALEALYASDLPDREKLARKREIVTALEKDLDLARTPNNASLAGFKTYNSGMDELAALFEACGRSWPRFLAAVQGVTERDFGEPQREDIGPVIELLTRRACPDP